jgi:hypothetical protein
MLGGGGAHNNIVGSGTMLQAGRLLVQFPMSLGFSVHQILPATPWPWVNSDPIENEYQEFLEAKCG